MLKFAGPQFAALVIAGAAVLPGVADEPRKPAMTAELLEDLPLTVSVSTIGRFAEGHAWYLSVNSAGQAELTVESPGHIRKQFQVSKDQLTEFRKVVADGRFFELDSEYGKKVPSGSERSITLTAGRHTHTVRIHYMVDVTAAGGTKLGEASQAVRLLVLVRGWFDEAEAVDHRKGDQAVLEAAKK